ncbi:DUF2213 domain-containing protein [bacterium]|nr:DUF2213 domain-containing protein [bacterium]
MLYYGTKISPHRIKNDEGFLTCLEVPVARTGTQFYLSEEIECKDKSKATSINGGYEVMRTEDEVFAPNTIASFEGKILTDEHPDELVTVDNQEKYNKGTVKNVKRGTGELKNFILADLVVYDKNLIQEIEKGKVGVSVGYLCSYEVKDNQLFQKDIICNHVAVVDEGRAGEQAIIRDKKTEEIMADEVKPVEEKVEQKDLDPNEDLIAKIGAMIESKIAPLAERIATLENCNKKDSLDELKEEAIQGREKAKQAEEQPQAEADEEQPQAEKSEETPPVEKEPESDEENVTASPEKIEEIAEDTYSKVIAGINKIKPIIAKMKDSKEKEMMTDSVRDILKPFLQKNKKQVKQAVNNVYKSVVSDSTTPVKKTIYDYQKQIHPKYKSQNINKE